MYLEEAKAVGQPHDISCQQKFDIVVGQSYTIV